jgi:regulator of sirC expression with transglutaminase-like and TPR domain
VYQRAGLRHKAIDAWERAMAAAPDDETRANIKEHMVSLL